MVFPFLVYSIYPVPPLRVIGFFTLHQLPSTLYWQVIHLIILIVGFYRKTDDLAVCGLSDTFAYDLTGSFRERVFEKTDELRIRHILHFLDCGLRYVLVVLVGNIEIYDIRLHIVHREFIPHIADASYRGGR